MVKRFTIVLILASMLLHCCNRIGLLSTIYQQRHEIAQVFGLIKDVPIAMCDSHYDFDRGLHIQSHDESDSTMPPFTLQVSEIHLYVNAISLFDAEPGWQPLVNQKLPLLQAGNYQTPPLSIFHPPS